MKNIHKSGLSLVEVILSIALATIIFGAGVQISLSFQTRNDLNNAATLIAHSLRQAQILSKGVEGNDKHGVYIDGGSITIFTGSSYASRVINSDDIYSIGQAISITGDREYIFDKLTGFPVAVGTTTLTTNSDSRIIIINDNGSINY